MLAGRYEDACADYRRAEAETPHDDVVRRARLLRQLANALIRQLDFAKAEESFAAADRMLGHRPEADESAWWAEWVHLKTDLVYMYYRGNRVDDMLTLVAEARPVIEGLPYPELRAQFLFLLTMVELRRNRYVITEEMLRPAREAVVLAQRSDNLVGLQHTHWFLGFLHLWHGDIDEADYHLRTGMALADRTGEVLEQARTLAYVTVVARKRGQVEEVIELARRCEDLSRAADATDYVATSLANLAWASSRTGNCEDAVRLGLEALDLFAGRVEGGEDIPTVWLAIWPLVAALLALGRVQEALRQAHRLLAPGVMRMPPELESSVEKATDWAGRDLRDAKVRLQECIRIAERTGWL